MGWPSKLTDRELKRDSLLISCTSPGRLFISRMIDSLKFFLSHVTCKAEKNYKTSNYELWLKASFSTEIFVKQFQHVPIRVHMKLIKLRFCHACKSLYDIPVPNNIYVDSQDVIKQNTRFCYLEAQLILQNSSPIFFLA